MQTSTCSPPFFSSASECIILVLSFSVKNGYNLTSLLFFTIVHLFFCRYWQLICFFKIIYQHRRHNKNLLMIHLIFVTKYRKKDWNNLKLHCKIAPKEGGASLSNLWNWRHLQKVTQYSKYSFTLLSNFNQVTFLAESDLYGRRRMVHGGKFQSAPSLRKVT